MKTKLICFWAALLLIAISHNGYSDDFYYYRDTKIQLQRVPNKYYLQTYTNVDVSKLEFVKDVFREPQPGINPEPVKQFMIKFNGYETEFGYLSVIGSDADISEFEKMGDVIYIAPAFFIGVGKTEALLTNFISVELKNADDIIILKQFAEKYSFDIVYYDNVRFWLSCDKNSSGNALQVANILFETENFIAVEPIFLNCVDDHGRDYCGTNYTEIIETQNAKFATSFMTRQAAQTLKITMPSQMTVQRSQIALYNIAGRRQKVTPVFNADGTVSILLSSIAAGSYILRINNDQRSSWQKQVWVR